MGENGRLPIAIKEFFSSTNAEDHDRLLECFTPDAILVDWDRRYEGRSGVANWDRTDNIGVQSRIEVVAHVPHFQGHRVAVSVSGNGFNGAGEMNFQLLDGKIALLRIT
ncbi:hypothetical protein BCY90_14905 [Agrobacterium deltaense]|nr:hypothetical protein BCY90_14905 [Agrobacterium deltaense]